MSVQCVICENGPCELGICDVPLVGPQKDVRYAFPVSGRHYTTCRTCGAARLHRTKRAADTWTREHECPKPLSSSDSERSR